MDKHDNILHLSQEKQKLLEQELSRINSRLSRSVETIEATISGLNHELEHLKRTSDSISTLYELLGYYLQYNA